MSKIILDQCNTHSVWFDIYELAAAMDFIHSRLDRSSAQSVFENGESLLGNNNEKLDKEEHEILEIKDEDLQLLLEEFQEWAQDSKTKNKLLETYVSDATIRRQH